MNRGTGFEYYLNWTKTLVAEMNAAIGCLHSNTEELKAAEREQAERVLVDLQEMRDGFEQAASLQGVFDAAGGKRRQRKRTIFEIKLAKDLKKFSEKAKQHLCAILRQQVVAQRKAWREFVGQLNALKEILVAKHHAEIGDLLKHLNADAEAAEVKLKQLSEAGSRSLCAVRSALRDTPATLGKAARQVLCRASSLRPAEWVSLGRGRQSWLGQSIGVEVQRS